MNKTQFLKSLKHQLRRLKRAERKKYINDYEEMISDMMENGMTEQEAISNLGDIKKISMEILENSEMGYQWIDWKGIGLMIISALLIAVSVFWSVNNRAFVIGGADGPTSIFLAGKVSHVSRIYIITGIVLVLTIVYLIIRRKEKRM